MPFVLTSAPEKANVAADALCRKERAKPLRVRALVMNINSNLPLHIHEDQVKALKKENVKDKNLHGMDKEFKTCVDGTLCIWSRSWLPCFRDIRELIMHEAHKSNYSIHSRSNKIYHNLKQLYRCPNRETSITTYVSKCLMCLRMRDDYEKPSGNRDHQKNYVNVRRKPLAFQVGADALCRKERAKPLTVRALVMNINSNLPLHIHEDQVKALKKENVKDKNLHGMDKEFMTCVDGTLCIRSRIIPMSQQGNMHRHICQQVLDVFKDEGRLREAIWYASTTTNTPLEIGIYSHRFYHKPTKDNKLLLHDLGNRDHQKNYVNVRRKPLAFQVGGIFVERSNTFWQTRKAEHALYWTFQNSC
nr:putative reverse transcriptase domain-containing protein [Tanacetum cinerariifolium]